MPDYYTASLRLAEMKILRVLSLLFFVGGMLGMAVPYSFGQGAGERSSRDRTKDIRARDQMVSILGRTRGINGPGMHTLLDFEFVREELKIDEDVFKKYKASEEKIMKEVAEELLASIAKGGGPADRSRRVFGAGRAGGGNYTIDSAKLGEADAALQERAEKKLGEILDSGQMDRLVGLYTQVYGTRTFGSKTIATRLKITADQKRKLKELEELEQKATKEAFSPGGHLPREKEKREREKERMDVLTQSQKDKMKSLKGAKFEFPSGTSLGVPQWYEDN